MASVHHNKLSPYWTASVRVWIPHPDHPRGGFWRRSRRSTRILTTERKRVAQAVANELERTANAAYDAKDVRHFYEQAVSRMLSAAGAANSKVHSWAQWSDQWISEQRGVEKTITKYTESVKKFTAHLGARANDSLRNITHSDCTTFYAAMEKSGLSSPTCSQHFKIIRWCLQRAFLHGLIERNPAALVQTDNTSTFQRKPFTPEEIKKILSHIDQYELKEWRTVCLFGLFYGLRLRDATRRKFEEITDENEMRVLRFVPQKKARKGKEITLPIVGELAELKGKGFITPALAKMSNPSKVFSRILKAAEIDVTVIKGSGAGRDQADKSFHSWRHTCNTMLSNNGVDVRLRQLISDHDSREMNARYTHPDLSSMLAALAPMASIIPRSHSKASASE